MVQAELSIQSYSNRSVAAADGSRLVDLHNSDGDFCVRLSKMQFNIRFLLFVIVGLLFVFDAGVSRVNSMEISLKRVLRRSPNVSELRR